MSRKIEEISTTTLEKWMEDNEFDFESGHTHRRVGFGIEFFGIEQKRKRYQFPAKFILSNIQESIENKFHELVKKWKEETAGMASPMNKTRNVHYLSIIKLGDSAIPLILKELERRPDDWFLILKVLTNANPIKQEDIGSYKRVTEAWLRWGKENNYI